MKLKPQNNLYKKQLAETRGRVAENLARIIYFFKGYRLLEKRFKCPLGEIDLIFKRGRTLVFTEVKYRAVLNKEIPILTQHQQLRIRRAAEWFLVKNQKLNLFNMRFDFIVISKGYFHVVKNAF